MDARYARAIAALNTAAKLAKEDTGLAEDFMKKNATYFPKKHSNNNKVYKNVPVFVPLNLKSN